jgi:hypothetical protein
MGGMFFLFWGGKLNDQPKPISRQNQKLTQQHNWKKSSSSPCAVSVNKVLLHYVALSM